METKSLIWGEWYTFTCRRGKGEGWWNRMGYTWVGITWFSIIFYIWFLYMYEVSIVTFVVIWHHYLHFISLIYIYILLPKMSTADWKTRSTGSNILPLRLCHRACSKHEIHYMDGFNVGPYNCRHI